MYLSFCQFLLYTGCAKIIFTLNNKNPQFLPYQAIISTQGLNIFALFHNDWVEIVDFLIKTYFWAYKSLFCISLYTYMVWNYDHITKFKLFWYPKKHQRPYCPQIASKFEVRFQVRVGKIGRILIWEICTLY